MAAFPMAALISAGGQLLSGLFDKSGEQAAKAAAQANRQNWSNTKTLNQNQIQWRVEDARKAGIHPLAALGVSPIGPYAGNVAAVGGSPSTGSAIGDAMSSLGREMASIQMADAQTELERKRLALESERLDLLAKAQSRTMINNAQQPAFLSRSGLPDTEGATTRYGELADYVFGPQVFWSDTKKNYRDEGFTKTMNKLDAGGAIRDAVEYLSRFVIPGNN